MRQRQATSRKYKSATDDEITKMIRFKRAHLDQLQKENSQIKSTMETHKRKVNEIDPNIFKQLHSLYEQTKTLEVKQDSEMRRYKAFQQLISYLEEEQVRQRKQEDLRYSTIKATEEKLLKRNEHQAEQILIRQNQEIAKINILRQQLQVSRSERVVYSNLFKKLEKEIRVYEEQFKELLLETALIEQKRLDELNVNVALQSKKKSSDKRTSRIQIDSFVKDERIPDLQIETQCKIKQKEKPKTIPNQSSISSYNHSFKSKNSYSSKYSDQKTERRQKDQRQFSLQHYQKLQLFMQMIIVQSECKDFQELIQQFKTLESSHQKMIQEIQLINSQISDYEIENKCTRSTAKSSSLEDDQLLQTIPLFTTKTSSILSDKQKESKLFRRDLIQIADLFGISYSDPLQVNEIFSLIQQSLSRFIQSQNTHINIIQFQNEEEENHLQRKESRRGEEQQNQIEMLIDRSERYNESQKIFEKQCFEEEYCKEIIRVRRVTKNKK